MDLRKDIKKATALISEDDDAKFYRLHGLSQAARDKKMNERILKPPRNANLISDLDGEDRAECMDTINNKVKAPFDPLEITAAIKEINGGRDLSNRCFEENFWRQLQSETSSEKYLSQNSSLSKHDNIKINQLKAKDLNKKCVKRKEGLFKNAAIMGLVNTKKISLEDLISSNNENSAREENETLYGITSNECITNGDEYVESVPLHEDPEIFIHPLRRGIDEKQFQNINFVPSLAKKKKITPAEHFLNTADENDFDFVKPTNRTT